MGYMAEWMETRALKEEWEYHQYHIKINKQYEKLGDNLEWTTRNEKKIKIKDMSTKHIRNCLGMLRRLNTESPWEYIFNRELILRDKKGR